MNEDVTVMAERIGSLQEENKMGRRRKNMSSKNSAEVCRSHGWGPGDVLHRAGGPRIVLTVVGEATVRAVGVGLTGDNRWVETAEDAWEIRQDVWERVGHTELVRQSRTEDSQASITEEPRDLILPGSEVVVKDYAVGMFYGTLVSRSEKGDVVQLRNARRVFLAEKIKFPGRGAIRKPTGHGLPVYGPGKKTKVGATVPAVQLLSVYKISLCADWAAKRLREAPEWTAE